MASRLRHLVQEAAPIKRPGCVGLRGATVDAGKSAFAVALFFTAQATTDDHTAPFDQSLVVTHGSGWVSIGDDRFAVSSGDAVTMPANVFHRFWTENELMEALALVLEMKSGPELIRVPDRAALARNSAERFVLAAHKAIEQQGRFSVALSGGSTPRALFELLATPEFSSQIDWQRVHVFWGDERGVPPTAPASNYQMANQVLLVRVPIPRENIHRILSEMPAADAARAYANTLREHFHPEGGALPRFDLILLGLGENGHTASLFPHTKLLHNDTDWVASEYIAEVKMERITLTAPVINAAKEVLFLVTGGDKAPTVRAVLQGEYRPEDLPAQLVRPSDGGPVWLLDCDAASKLTMGA